MWSPKAKPGSRRPDRQVLLTGAYVLAMVATLLLLTKTNVINTAGVRLWFYAQPRALVPPCGGGGGGMLQSVDCSGAAAAVEQRQKQLVLDGKGQPSLASGAAAEEVEQVPSEVVGAAEEEGGTFDQQQEGDTARAAAGAAEPAAESGGAAEEVQAGAGVAMMGAADGAARERTAAAVAAKGQDADEAQRAGQPVDVAEEDVEEEGQAGPAGQEPDEQQEPAAVEPGAAQAARGEAAQLTGAAVQGGPAKAEPKPEPEAGPQGPSPYHQALAGCEDLDCLREAAEQPRSPGQFRFPHFFIVGWQKCATTSLFLHLAEHPSVLRSADKEPEFFSHECGYDPQACPRKAAKKYINKTLRRGAALAVGLEKAAVEASTHYGRNGHMLAPRLREAFPWLRVIVSLREPISRAMSMLAHNLDKHDLGCLARADAYRCLSRDLEEQYAPPLQGWLEAFPRDQVYLIQYENMTSSATMSAVLHDVKRYLGIHPELPHSDLGMKNTREIHLQRKGELRQGEEADGWPMKKWQYQALVKQVRPDAQRVADLAGEYGLADSKQWMRNWEQEWQMTLDECDDEGNCIVFPN